MKIRNKAYIGVILAAGRGSRLSPLTDNIPKCLLKISGKTILQYQIDAYHNAGIKKIIIVTGYQSKKIEMFIKEKKYQNIKIIENDRYKYTNNMYSFYLASKYLKKTRFILNNGDVVIDKNIIKHLINYSYKSCVAIDKSIFLEESMKINLNSEGFISDISKKINKKNSKGVSIDFYKFSITDAKIFIKEVSKIINIDKNYIEWTEIALQRLFHSEKLKFKPFNILKKNWFEIDTYDDLKKSIIKFSNLKNKLKNNKILFLDLDGTIYLGNNLIPGVPKAIRYLRKNHQEICFISNNSSKNKSDFVKKLNNFNIRANEDEIVLSSDLLINFLKKDKVIGVYVLGTKSLKKNLIKNGINVKTKKPEYVVIGYDTELNYKKLITACFYINKNIKIIATHCDVSCPSKYGPIPDAGSLIKLIHLTTGKLPYKIFGKPNKSMILDYLRLKKIKPINALVVGDRLETDVLMAHNAKTKSLLVFTGNTNNAIYQNSKIEPDFILNSFANINKL